MEDKKYSSITDLPLENSEEDQLQLNDYASGLYNFIKSAETSISIAIQGDWGTGKTSILNLIIDSNKSDKDVLKMFYINTWQFSQFNGSESLYFSFVTSLIKQMELGNEELKHTLLKFGKLALAAGISAMSIAGFADTTSFIEAAEKMAERMGDQVVQITEAKKEFEKLVKDYIKRKGFSKLVILVDDLDRLPPKTAVELLETIKLFLDVKNCVFVLAIDYDVVVQGVREKFGKSISDEKCKNFFDKIIQLPFRMPVESYTSYEILKKYLNESKFEKDQLKNVSLFIDQSIGANPRTLKRIINSFYLIEHVIASSAKDRGKEKVFYALLLIFLSLQIHFPFIYTATVNILKEGREENLPKEFVQIFEDYIKEKLKISEVEIASYIPVIQNLYSALNKILDGLDFNKELNDAVHITSITSLSGGQPAMVRKSATKINKIRVFDEAFDIKSGYASEALAKTIELLMKKSPDKLNEMTELDFIRVGEEGEKNSIFRAVQKIAINEKNYFIATSTGIDEKKKEIKKACEVLDVKPGAVEWLNDGESVFCY